MWRLFEKNNKTEEKQDEKKLTYSYSADFPDNQYTLLRSATVKNGIVDASTYIPRIGESVCLDYAGDEIVKQVFAKVTDVFYNIPLDFICIHTEAYAMEAVINGERKFIEFKK